MPEATRSSWSTFRDWTIWQHLSLTCGVWLLVAIISEAMRLNGLIDGSGNAPSLDDPALYFVIFYAAMLLRIWLPILAGLLLIELSLVAILRMRAPEERPDAPE